MGKRKKQHEIESKENIREILTSEPDASLTRINGLLHEKYNRYLANKTLANYVRDVRTEKPTEIITTTSPDSTIDEIENLTSLIAKLNKEFDKTDSNSERCRITDAIVSASKGRADLLLKKDERERLRATKENKVINVWFDGPNTTEIKKPFKRPIAETKPVDNDDTGDSAQEVPQMTPESSSKQSEKCITPSCDNIASDNEFGFCEKCLKEHYRTFPPNEGDDIL